MMGPIEGTLALLAGCLGLSIAVYIQFFAEDVPAGYALAYYALGSGILLIVYEIVTSWSAPVVTLAVLLVIASEIITASSLFREYGVAGALDSLRSGAGGKQ